MSEHLAGSGQVLNFLFSPLGQQLFCGPKIVLDLNPPRLRRTFLEGVAKGSDGLFQARRAAFTLAEHREREAEIVLGRRPVEGRTFARLFLEGVPIGGDRLLQARDTALAAL